MTKTLQTKLKENMEHYLNPLHLVYCPMKRMGFNKRYALSMSRVYENTLYKYALSESGSLLFHKKEISSFSSNVYQKGDKK